MALNVRAAMLICMVVIGGMSWLVQQIDTPVASAASPLAAGVAPVDLARVVDRPEAMSATGPERRSEWARQFTHPNALDAEAERHKAMADSLALLPPVEPFATRTPPASLPPLVDKPRDALAAAEQADRDGLPAVADPPALASAAEPADQLPATPSPTFGKYRVVKGDTLVGIALREWNATDTRLVKLLVAANAKLQAREDQHQIYVGETLLIPDAATAELVLAGRVVPGDLVFATAPPEQLSNKWYTIERNDTLAGIARRFLNDGNRWREIAEVNRALNPNRIIPGTRIRLPPVIRVAVRS